MTDDLTRPGNLQLAQASGEGNTNQDIVAVTQPPNGGETILPSLANRVYDLRFDPRLAQVRVVDADGDGDLDVVLLFNAGTAEQSRIVFVDMVEAAQSGLAPALQVGEQQFGADVVVRQAQTLAGEQPTLEATATAGPEAEGTGVTEYDDNLGNLIDLLNAQGVIPGVEMAFPSIEPTVAEEDEDSAESAGLQPPIAFGFSVISVEGELVGIPGSEVSVGGFVYRFDVGEENDISDNIRGTDAEDGVTTAFTITSLADIGVLVIDRGSDGTLDEIYGVSDTFIPAAQALPPGGLDISSDDTVFSFLPVEELIAEPLNGSLPESSGFTYFTTDSDGLNSDQAAVQIGFTAPVTVVGSNEDDEDGQPEPHTVPNPNEEDSGPILGGAGADVLIGDLGGAIVGDLNVAIIIDISGSMVDPDNNPAPGVTRLDVIQDALEEILPQLAGRDAKVNLFVETFSRDSDDPLFIGELTTDNVHDIIVDIFALDSEAGSFTNYEAALTDMRDWYLGQLAATDGFTNVAFFLTDGFPNRSLDDNGEVQGTGLLFQQDALDEALAAIPDVLDQSSGVFSGDDQILLNAIGTSNALESTLDQLDTTGGAELVDLGDPSTVPDAFAISGVNVGSDVISGGAGDDIIFGDVPNSDALALAEGIDLPLESGFAVFQALEAGQSPSSPGWGRGDTIAYLRDPANQSDLIGAGRGEGDTIDAGAGNDLIFAQGGDDSLTGGTGADTFLYTLAADEGDDEILDFSTAEGDVLSFVNVTDTDASGTIGIEDVVDSFIDGGGAGAVDTVVLASGTTIMITDVSGGLTDLNSLEANTLINAAMA